MTTKTELRKEKKNLERIFEKLLKTEYGDNIFINISKEITHISRQDLGELISNRDVMIIFIQDRIAEIEFQLRARK